MDTGSARDLLEHLPERVRGWRPQHALDALPQSAVERLPAGVQQRLGRKRRRPRWLVIGVAVGLLAVALWLGLRVKRALAPGIDEDEFDENEPLGEPLSYPAAGSGSGWPNGARSPENTEPAGNSAGAATASAAMPRPPSPPPAPPPLPENSHRGAGAAPAGQTGRLAADQPAPPAGPTSAGRPQDLSDATLPFPASPPASAASRPLPPDPKQALAGTVWAESRDVAPAQPSEPAQRPPIPFSESQAETNARLQLRQEELLAAFPGMSRSDIVECDGDLDRLAVILSTKLGRPIDEVRSRVDAVLGTGAPQQQQDTGIEPDLSVRDD
ncbi:MAG TPA: hypothetical protein VKV26_18360 [Dehalococcoidia bacterium]|nr:hypothetical protein [Dehalococcoidia bacterium]